MVLPSSNASGPLETGSRIQVSDVGLSPWSIGLRVGAELVTALILGVAIGLALDHWLHTKPVFPGDLRADRGCGRGSERMAPVCAAWFGDMKGRVSDLTPETPKPIAQAAEDKDATLHRAYRWTWHWALHGHLVVKEPVDPQSRHRGHREDDSSSAT